MSGPPPGLLLVCVVLGAIGFVAASSVGDTENAAWFAGTGVLFAVWYALARRSAP